MGPPTYQLTIALEMNQRKGRILYILIANILASSIAIQVDRIFCDRVRRKQGELNPRSRGSSLFWLKTDCLSLLKA